ncbi:MAG: AGE family epimerase/isomerase [Rhodocyclaceae bacterium]
MEKSGVEFRSRAFLLEHIRSILAFYDARCVDVEGGFFQCYEDDGTIFDRLTRTLVASCRFVFNYAMAYRTFGLTDYLDRVRHGLAYLRDRHRDPATGGYTWRIEQGESVDRTNHCYGLAFVMLAYSAAVRAGVSEARPWIDETWALMERHFWLPEDNCYANEATADWQVQTYRGQNDNMHACEALIAAYEATGEHRYLARAQLLAHRFTVELAAPTGGQVWEHFTTDWRPDLDYNRHDRSNHIRPWGVQTGHQTEWAKLLLILNRHSSAEWYVERARALFDTAVARGWDDQHGGLIYGYDLQGVPCDCDKYFWVQAESIAAAALLADATGDDHYWQWYVRIWQYAWTYFVDHTYGAWYRVLSPDNCRYSNRKSYSNKADYHTMGACYEALNVIPS